MSHYPGTVTFTNEELSDVLISLARGDNDLAVKLVSETDSLPDDLRSSLRDLLSGEGEPGELISGFADAMRVSGISNRGEINQIHRAAFYAGDQWAALARNPLFSYFLAARSALGLDKWIQYFDVYDRHLSRFRGTDVSVLEIGTFKGGGLAMLQDYLGPKARLVGMDIDPAAVASIGDRFNVVLGDQEQPDSLTRISEEFGPFDVVIEDGGHTMKQQIVTAETLFPLLNDGGVYLSEDLHTSYWGEFGGGLGRDGTFIEWVKDRIDDINGYHAGTDEGGAYGTTDFVTDWTRSVGGLHVYDSVIVMDKKRVPQPFCELSGTFHHLRQNRGEETLIINLSQARDSALTELEQVRSEDDKEIERLKKQKKAADAALTQMKSSGSWRITKPLRKFRSRFGK